MNVKHSKRGPSRLRNRQCDDFSSMSSIYRTKRHSPWQWHSCFPLYICNLPPGATKPKIAILIAIWYNMVKLWEIGGGPPRRSASIATSFRRLRSFSSTILSKSILETPWNIAKIEIIDFCIQQRYSSAPFWLPSFIFILLIVMFILFGCVVTPTAEMNERRGPSRSDWLVWPKVGQTNIPFLRIRIFIPYALDTTKFPPNSQKTAPCFISSGSIQHNY